MTTDEAGNVYIIEPARLRRVTPSFMINTFAGFAFGSPVPAGVPYSSVALLATGGKLFALNTVYGIRSLALSDCRFPVQPAISVDGIFNAAPTVSYANLTQVSPGEIISIYGAGLGPAPGVSTSYPGGIVSSQLAGTRVLFNGVPGPVLYTSAGQVNAITPSSLSGTGVCASVEFNGIASDVSCRYQGETVPAIFVIQNQDGTINSSTNPAGAGSVITVWGSGFGAFVPPVLDGQIVSSAGTLALPVHATTGGVPADVQYAGPAPGLVAGVAQLNTALPAASRGAPAQVQLAIFVGKTELDSIVWAK